LYDNTGNNVRRQQIYIKNFTPTKINAKNKCFTDININKRLRFYAKSSSEARRERC
jgi:hypothetical protein